MRAGGRSPLGPRPQGSGPLTVLRRLHSAPSGDNLFGVGSKVSTANVGKIDDLLPSWMISLQAGRKSEATVYTYTSAVQLLFEFLQPRGMPTAVARIKREHIEAF